MTLALIIDSPSLPAPKRSMRMDGSWEKIERKFATDTALEAHQVTPLLREIRVRPANPSQKPSRQDHAHLVHPIWRRSPLAMGADGMFWLLLSQQSCDKTLSFQCFQECCELVIISLRVLTAGYSQGRGSIYTLVWVALSTAPWRARLAAS